MHLPIHGYERILGRTEMHADNVVALIEADACVSLGKREGREYVLFYSPFDRRAKIAVLTAFRQVLITVLERDEVPSEIDPVTAANCMESEARLQRYVWKRVAHSRETMQAWPVTVSVRARAALYGKREQLLHLEQLGTIAKARAQNVEDLAANFKDQLRPLMRGFPRSKNWVRDRLRYTFELDSGSAEITYLPPIRHPVLNKLVRAA